MRWFFILFFSGIFPLAAGEPGKAALELIEDLRDPEESGKIVGKLEISKFCGPRKERAIKENWQARASWAREGKYEFRVLDEKSDGELGAVLIGASTPENPELAEVISLVLVRRDGNWKVGPVEGRFENTDLGFDEEILKRAGELELWVARERVGAIAELRSAELRKFRGAMAGAVPDDDLKTLGPSEVVERFISDAEAGNTNALIVWQGYFERDEFPEVDWERNLRLTRLGLAGKDRQKVWRLLTSKQVMKVVMDDDEEGGEKANILVGFLSAYETGTMNDHVNPVRFPLTKTKAGWRVELPVFFSLADEEARAFRNARNRNFNWEDRTGVKRMFGVFEERNEKIREKEAETVLQGMRKDLSQGDLDTFLRRHYRFVEEKKKEKDDDDDDDVELPAGRFIQPQRGNGPDEQRAKIYEEAVKWWSESLKSREELEVEVSGVFFEGETGLAILSLPPSADTWKPVYQKLWLGKRKDGWLILPGREEPLGLSFPEEHTKDIARLKGRYLEEEERITEALLQKVLKVVVLDQGKGSAAPEEKALELVGEWRETARTKGMLPLLKQSAVRERPKKAELLLRNVGFLRQGAAAAAAPDEILGTKAAGRYRAVSIAVEMVAGTEMQCPLMIVVPVKGGHRVLVDIELPFETNGGISILNEERLDELSNELSKEDLAAIKELREWHQKTARPVWEKWKQVQAANKE